MCRKSECKHIVKTVFFARVYKRKGVNPGVSGVCGRELSEYSEGEEVMICFQPCRNLKQNTDLPNAVYGVKIGFLSLGERIDELWVKVR